MAVVRLPLHFKSRDNPLRLGTVIVLVSSGIDFVNTPLLYSSLVRLPKTALSLYSAISPKMAIIYPRFRRYATYPSILEDTKSCIGRPESASPEFDKRQYFLRCRPIGFELSASENSVEFPAESGCKAKDLTRYKVDTACRVLPYI